MTDGRATLAIAVKYKPESRTGTLSLAQNTTNTIWERIQQSASTVSGDAKISALVIELPWPSVLDILREYATRELQHSYSFRFQPEPEALRRIQEFAAARREVQAARGELQLNISEEDVRRRLSAAGFSRELMWFQMRDVRHLLSLQNGANFSVPGAGKTTVAFALHLLTRQFDQHLFVVCPKAAFQAWRDVVTDCTRAGELNSEPFQILTGSANMIEDSLRSGGTRFAINYDLLIQHPGLFGSYLARKPTHLVVDESHRMKAGEASQRGALLLSLAPLPVRRDILSGTPLPQSPNDLISQLDFLWPGQGLGVAIARGAAPKDVLGRLYVRTTKEELGLPPRTTRFHQVEMAKGQLALYSLVRSETLRQLSNVRASPIDFISARKSVMRLLQLSTNPLLALRAITNDVAGLNSGLIDQVVADGPSPKMLAVAAKARELAIRGRKSVVWTIFTDTIEQMRLLLADLNPVALYGAVPSGEESDPLTREGQLRRFHLDQDCMVMIANPAAAGEGISLHTVCHEALYIDRSYNSTHFLQSIDRIHRLGLRQDEETNVHIFQSKAPQGVGCIDHSVSRRLARKIRDMQVVLDDHDLHQIALDEENSDEPIAYDIEFQDIVDLVDELEGRMVFNTEDGA